MRAIYGLLTAVMPLFTMATALQAQSITPATVTLNPSQTESFSVTPGVATEYTWSISPSSGSITTSGKYTAPASITAESKVTVTATRSGEPTLTATVTLMPLVSISISPSWISMTNGQSAVFTPTVTGASNTAVTWNTPAFGSITSGGVYTVPMTLTSSQNITVTA